MKNFYQSLKDDPHYFKQFTCKELLFLNYDCPVKDRKYDMWSEYSYFFYVITGKKAWMTPGHTWTITRGDAIFVRPGACIVEQYFEEPFCVLVFFLPDSYVKRFFEQHSALLEAKPVSPVRSELVIPVETDDVMLHFYNSVMPYFRKDVPPPEEWVELKFNELLLNLITNPANEELISYLRSSVKLGTGHLRQVMEENYHYNLGLADYARLCHRSLSSFRRDFQAAYGMPPSRWLQEKKLAFAHQLLLNSDLKIEEITFESGFENSTHLSKVYKQKYGKAPTFARKERLLSQPGLATPELRV